MYSKDFGRLSVKDRACWLVGNMLCSELEDDTPELIADYGSSAVLVRTVMGYAVIFQDEDMRKLKTVGFECIKDLYNYLVGNCRDWRIDD